LIRNPRAILALLTALNLLNYLDRYVLSSVLQPLQEELRLSNFVGGSLATVFLLGFFVTSPLFGHWGDRSGVRGRRALIVVGVLVWSLATIATGLAHGPVGLIVARAFVGVGEASYVTLAPTIIDEVAPPARGGRWLALFYTAIPVGSALGYLTGGAVESATHSWRQAFYVAGLPGVLLGFACLLIQEPPRRAVHERINLFAMARKLMAIPLYRSLVLGQAAYTFAIGGFAYWAPKYLAARYGMETGRASFVFGLVTVVGGAVGTVAGGWSGDRVTRGILEDAPTARGNLLVCAVATAVGAPLAAAAIGASTSTAFFVLVLPCQIALFMTGGPFNVALLRSVPTELRASAMALSIFGAHLLGDLWSPPLIGVVADHAPMVWAMTMCPAIFALAAVVWWRGRLARAVARQTPIGRRRRGACARRQRHGQHRNVVPPGVWASDRHPMGGCQDELGPGPPHATPYSFGSHWSLHDAPVAPTGLPPEGHAVGSSLRQPSPSPFENVQVT
jgi:MFS family permease